MNKQEQVRALIIKQSVINSKKVDLDDIPNWVENRIDAWLLCSDCWYSVYFETHLKLEKAIDLLNQQILIEQMLELDISKLSN